SPKSSMDSSDDHLLLGGTPECYRGNCSPARVFRSEKSSSIAAGAKDQTARRIDDRDRHRCSELPRLSLHCFKRLFCHFERYFSHDSVVPFSELNCAINSGNRIGEQESR